MTEFRRRATEMLQAVPDDKMIYVIDMLKWMNTLFAGGVTSARNMPESKTSISSGVVETWSEFMKYKGIIHHDIDERAELAKARDEKYADFD